MLRKWLFHLAKSPLMGRLVGLGFRYCGRLIPVKRVCMSRDVIAFRHPQPCYTGHLILSPRRSIRSLLHMADAPLCRYLGAIRQTVLAIRAVYPEYRDSFTLVANGGRKQEVQQVHFHMFTGHDFVRPLPPDASIPADHTGSTLLMPHPVPDWELHYIIRPAPDGDASSYDAAVLQRLSTLAAEHGLTQRGYSLVWRCDETDANTALPILHIVSGKRLH